MANDINPIVALFDNEPSLIREGRSTWFQACCQVVAAHSGEIAKIAAAEEFWFAADDWRSAYRPYNVKSGILTIPVKGLLLNNFSIILGTFATGYDYIWQAVKRGMTDPEVKGIVFSIDSGGGMVAGNFSLVDRIYGFRGTKPMEAHTESGAYSAAYSIASAADKIVCTDKMSSGVGSIGVVTTHFEYSEAMTKAGITTTIVRSKPRKMEGNAYEPLSDAAREAMQTRIDAMHQQFVAIVARNRDMKEAAVDGTDALCFMPKEAIDCGLADEISNAEDAFTAFVASFNSEEKETLMADEIKAGITEEAHAAAVAAARAEGAQAERTRIAAIMDSDAAKERPAMARKLALTTDMTAEASASFMADLPAEKTEKAEAKPEATAAAGVPKQMFEAAMNGSQNPDLSAGTDGSARTSRVASTLALAKGDAN